LWAGVFLIHISLSALVAQSRRQVDQTNAPIAGSTIASAPHSSLTPAGRHPREAALMKRRWGVEVLGVQQASGGYMLEFRFRVLDAKLAASLFDRKIRPQLIDSATGARVIVPSPEKVGELRNVNPPEAGRNYWIMFANPGKFISPGRKVSVVIGDFRADGLIVN
jgi:hypothetical protein